MKLSNLSSVIYSRTGISEMWILKISSELLQKMNSFHYPKITLIQAFDFSTLYTSIPHQKLTDRIQMLVNQTFLYKNGSRRCKHLVTNGDGTLEDSRIQKARNSRAEFSERMFKKTPREICVCTSR